MSELKILYQDNWIKLFGNEGDYSIEEINSPILILPYTTSDGGYPDTLGVLGTKSPKEIVVNQSDDDTDIFSTAKRGLKEVTGFTMEESDKWDFLGPIKSSSFSISGNPAFSVNITGLISEDLDNIGSKNFSLIKVSDALDSDNSVLHSLFLKTFQFKNLSNNLK